MYLYQIPSLYLITLNYTLKLYLTLSDYYTDINNTILLPISIFERQITH